MSEVAGSKDGFYVEVNLDRVAEPVERALIEDHAPAGRGYFFVASERQVEVHGDSVEVVVKGLDDLMRQGLKVVEVRAEKIAEQVEVLGQKADELVRHFATSTGPAPDPSA